MLGNKPLADKIAEKLIQFIIDNDFKAGQKLPNETELTQSLHVGRSTVREAVKLLVSKNILDVRQGSGTFVVEQGIGISNDPLGLTFIKDKKKLTKDLLEIRIILEPRLAELAAMNAEPEDIEELEKICREIEELILTNQDHTKKDVEFHEVIAKCSKNLVAPNFLPTIQAAISLFIKTTNNVLRHETIQTHQALVDSIKNRDPVSAHDAMLLHLVYNRNILYSYLKEN